MNILSCTDHVGSPTPTRGGSLALCAVLLSAGFASAAHAAVITFGNSTVQSGDTDVLNVGAFNYGYNWSNAGVTVNGVTFAGTNIIQGASTAGAGDISLTSSGGLTSNTSAFTIGSNPFAALSADYKNLTKGASYLDLAGATITVSLNNLTSNHVYAVQTWNSDSRATGASRSSTITGGGGAVTLDYNSTDAAGGLGQYTVGGFTANATSQNFTLTSNNVMVQAVQVRDVTGVWSGAASGNWDGSSANWTGGNNYLAVSGLVNTVYFGDTDGFKGAVSNKTVAVDSGGITAKSLVFQNTSAAAYAINGPGALTVTGDISKSGNGGVVFGGAVAFGADPFGVNTHSLIASGSSGHLQFNGVVSGSGVINATGNGTTDTIRFNNSANTFNGTINALSGRNEFSTIGEKAIFNVANGAEVNLKLNTFKEVTINLNGGTGVNVAGDAVALRLGGTNLDSKSTINLASGTNSSIGVNRDYGNVGAKITGAGAVTFGSQNVNGTNSGASSSAAGELILLNTANDWTGGLTITSTNDSSKNNQQVVKLGNNEVITNTNSVNFTSSGGVVNDTTVKNTSILNLNGKVETVDLLISTGGNGLITNTSGTASTLIIGGADLANATATFSGVIRNGIKDEVVGGQTSSNGLVSLTKIGSGMQILSGVNLFTGTTTVLGGTLALTSTGSLASTNYVIGTGGIFDVSAKASYSLAAVATTIGIGSSTAGFFNGGSASITLGGALTLNFDSTTTLATSYNLFDYASQSGHFSSVTLSGSHISGSLINGGSDIWTGTAGGYNLTFDETSGILSAVAIPEPSSYAAVAGLGLIGFTVLRRRGKKF